METPDMALDGDGIAEPRTWGEWQKSERDARGWSQPQLARASGVSERSIKRYERGGSPRGEHVWLILSAFGFPIPASAPLAVNAELAQLREETRSMRLAVLGLFPPAKLRALGADEAEITEALRRVIGGTDVAQ